MMERLDIILAIILAMVFYVSIPTSHRMKVTIRRIKLWEILAILAWLYVINPWYNLYGIWTSTGIIIYSTLFLLIYLSLLRLIRGNTVLNMKKWKKGAIVGGVWGLVSVIFVMCPGCSGTVILSLKQKILGFPWYSMEIVNSIHQTYFCTPTTTVAGGPIVLCRVLIQGTFAFIWPILIGALIGGGIGYLIDKRKTKVNEG